MPKGRAAVRALRERAANSLILAIELFNRPQDRGRTEAVLILLQHAFEMLLKAIIVDKTGVVHEKSQRFTYGFERCLRIAHEELQLLSQDERSTLSNLDSQRDIVSHYFSVLSEDLLYVHAQSATTLFGELLNRAFSIHLSDLIPTRVLPVSPRPPTDLQILIGSELAHIDALLTPNSRKGPAAEARLYPLVAMARSFRGETERVSRTEILKAVRRRRQGHDWHVILPDVAQLHLDTAGQGASLSLTIRKDGAVPVRIVKEPDQAVGTILKHEVNIWDKYNMGRDDLAKKLAITGPRASAIIEELEIQQDPDCFKLLRRKKSQFKGYSKRALDRIRKALNEGLDVDAVWLKHRHKFGARRRA